MVLITSLRSYQRLVLLKPFDLGGSNINIVLARSEIEASHRPNGFPALVANRKAVAQNGEVSAQGRESKKQEAQPKPDFFPWNHIESYL